MEEFPDELMAKYTRRELEAMAIDLEVDTMGLSTKSQFAEAIFEARRMIKETSSLSSPAKPSEMADPTEISEVERAEVVVPPMEAEMASPKEASAEKLPTVNIQVGVNGVLAKKAAIDEESRSMHEKALAIQKAGQNMRQDGIKHMQKAIDAQVKENERSRKNFDQGLEEIRIEIDKKSRSMRKKVSAIQKAGQNMRQDGIKHMQSRVSEMQKAIDAQVKENERSLKNFDQGVEEIRIDIDNESRSMTKKALEIQKAGQKMRLDGIKQMQKNVGDFKAEIDEFVKLDMENYVKDFYYG
jgi:phosphoribosyl-dephospho-CoA transferase